MTELYDREQTRRSARLAYSHGLEPVLSYLNSKVSIGVVKLAVIGQDGDGTPHIKLTGVSGRMWDDVIKPEIKRMIDVDEKFTTYREDEKGSFVHVQLFNKEE